MKQTDRIKVLYEKLLNETITEVEFIEFLQRMKQDPPAGDLDERLEQQWSEIWESDESEEARSSSLWGLNISRGWGIAACLVLLLMMGLFIAVPNFREIQKSTTYGEVQKINLPDGSVVTLNANSSLTWLNRNSKTERRIRLSGEAYFDVSPDSTRPFIVEVGMMKIEVLGTSFNVKNRGRYHEVFLEDGKIKIHHEQKDREEASLVLMPGEAVHFDPDINTLEKTPEDLRPNTLWKDGLLQFRNTSTAKVMEEMEDLYGVKISIEAAGLAERPLDITLPYVEWKRVGEALALTLGVEMIKESDRYTFTEL